MISEQAFLGQSLGKLFQMEPISNVTSKVNEKKDLRHSNRLCWNVPIHSVKNYELEEFRNLIMGHFAVSPALS